jgi:ATP synthase protein I
MVRPLPPSPERAEAPTSEASAGDPWHAFGYLTSGVMLYALVGWLLDQWLGTSFFVVVGILGGAVLGLYLTWTRFRPADAGRASQEARP